MGVRLLQTEMGSGQVSGASFPRAMYKKVKSAKSTRGSASGHTAEAQTPRSHTKGANVWLLGTWLHRLLALTPA